MRVRYMKESPEILSASRLVEEAPQKLRGAWRANIGTETLCLEIGCGLGSFIGEMARLAPQEGWIGLERIGTVLAKASQRLEKGEETSQLQNLRLIHGEAQGLAEIFAPGELDRIYLNFSDPWPKARHAKRRLTSEGFLRIYAEILREGGILQMKTDNDDLYAYSLEQIQADGWEILCQSEDLHHSVYAEGNVMTEYEAKFTEQGKTIHFFRAAAPKK